MRFLLPGLAAFALLAPNPCAAAAPDSMTTGAKVVVHYHRPDGAYKEAGLWTWDGRNERQPDDQEMPLARTDDFGAVFEFDPSAYGPDDSDADRVGMIPRLRKDWNTKDGTDRFWSPGLGRVIFIISGDPKVYTERPDISPRVVLAAIDGARAIRLHLSHPAAAGAVVADKVTLTDHSAKPVHIASVKPLPGGDAGHFFLIETAADIDITSGSYTAAVAGYRAVSTSLGAILDDPKLFVPEGNWGPEYTPERTVFRLFSPTAKSVSVVTYRDHTLESREAEHAMEKKPGGVWEKAVEGDLEGKHYLLRVATEEYGTNLIIDPLAWNTVGTDSPARITDLRKTDPEGFRPVKRPDYGANWTDAIIYQMHIRDFTISPSSGVSAANRGKFLGSAETGTHLPGDPAIKTVIEHLKELGVTHVQIQPIHDFDNDELKPDYNWGYMTAFFNSPDGWFASDIRGPARIREFKQFIKAMHDANIGVVLDVVYNHTGVQNTFEKAAPGYYLRRREDGSFWNGSGTGNEFRSEAPMGRRFIVESCKFWVEEYGIDGFRFDLMGLIDLETMLMVKNELEAVYPRVLVYGEPWAALGQDGVGIKKLVYKDVVKGTGLGAFNDHFRNALKGSPDGHDPGYVQDGSNRDGVRTGIAGSIEDWAAHPAQSINYASVHDNLDLWDKLLVSAPRASDEERTRMVMLTGGILAVSQGMMLMHSGTDFCRYKQGNHNSYNAGDSVNQIDWERKKTYKFVHDYYRGLIAMRKAHPMFRLATTDEVRERLEFHEDDDLPAKEAIGFTLSGKGIEGESWEEAVVFINPTAGDLTFKVPAERPYRAVVHGNQAGVTGGKPVTGEVIVSARSMTVLARP